MDRTASRSDPGLASDLEFRIAEACRQLTGLEDGESIRAAVQQALPQLPVQLAMTRGGWYRLGGVVDGSGQRIADQIAEWAARESGGKVEILLQMALEGDYFATRFSGRTHYLVAPFGPGARDFLQIEIEQLQEVLDHSLNNPEWFPDSVAEFIDPDPLDCPRIDPDPIGTPRAVFRRLVRVDALMASDDAHEHLRRFLEDWDRSSAGESEVFCEHWLLALHEYLDRDGEGHVTIKPLPLIHDQEPPLLPDAEVARGALLANRIHGFDRALGYPFAWYFHMLTSPKVSWRLAQAVHDDQMEAYDYLPARDLRILRDWYRDPYGL